MHIQESAGAPEPGAAAVTVEEDDEAVLSAAFYTVGLQQSALDAKKARPAQAHCQNLARDIAKAFQLHRLDVLCLCELGEHGIGLQGSRHMGCGTQEELLQQITAMVNDDFRGDAPELAAHIQLVSGEHAAYAAFKRRGSMLAVEEVVFHTGLDTRPGDRRCDRTMLTLNCTWMNEPIKITCCECPASVKRPWNMNVRYSVLPNVFNLAGLVPFPVWSSGASKPTAWILGGNLNLGDNTLRNEVRPYLPPHDSQHMVQVVHDGEMLRHGDRALLQHMTAFQLTSRIGVDHGGVSDVHNMVIVQAKRIHHRQRTGVAEPTGANSFEDANPQ